MEHEPADGDAELLRRFAAGDGDALGLLASRYEPSLLGIARGLLARDEHAARDAVQECWMRVIRHAARFRGESSVHTWIYRILVNRCLDRRAADRSKQRNTDASGSGGGGGGGGGEGGGGAEPEGGEGSVGGGWTIGEDHATSRSVNDPANDPGVAMVVSDLNHAVADAVESLPESMRVVLILCYHRGLTHAQSAEILGIPLGTLKTRLHAALTSLRETLAVENAR